MKHLLPILFFALASATTARADATVSLQDDNGTKYVNMPTTGNYTLPLDSADVILFKVYDDGGKSGAYSESCNGYLFICAPSSCLLELSGTISSESYKDWLTVYDGNALTDSNPAVLVNRASSTFTGRAEGIPTVVSSGSNLTLCFFALTPQSYDGLDLTVKVMDTNANHTVAVANPDAGGTMIVGQVDDIVVGGATAQAKYNQTVTLSATPASGYVLCDIDVKDVFGASVAVDWEPLSNTATFRMPAFGVTVTPTFTDDTLSYFFVNMPQTGTETLEIGAAGSAIPAGVEAFKVYDNGGKDGNYYDRYGSTLVMTAPDGYLLQLSGTLETERGYDRLDVHDGASTDDRKLLDGVSSSANGVPTAIPTVVSSGRSMTLSFHPDTGDNFAGFDFVARLVDPAVGHAVVVTNPAAGGAVSSDKATATPNETVVLTATPSDGYLLGGIGVTLKDGSPVSVANATWYTYSDTNKASFAMPGADVTVSPTFVPIAGLHIDMPANGTVVATIPGTVESFAVYDDGGASGAYAGSCDGTLVLNAPEGRRIRLSGSIQTESGNDTLTIRDGDDPNGTALLDGASGTIDIPAVVSTGRSMTLQFHSDSSFQFKGLSLVAESLSALGTPDDPIVIASADDWEKFAANVNAGRKADLCYRLAADISVSTMAGTASNPFRGVFDGGGHTLDLAIVDTENQGAAPFRYIAGAAVCFVRTTGTVTGNLHCSGLVGFATGGINRIQGCEVAANVVCSGGSHSHCGGILGHGLSSNTTIRDSMFSGSISGATTATGVIYGWGDDGTHAIQNCLAAGTYTDCNGIELLRRNAGRESIVNCYKTQEIGSQGVCTDATGGDLQALLGPGWQTNGTDVLPVMDGRNLGTATIAGIREQYAYTGSAIDLDYVVTRFDGTVLTNGTDYAATIVLDGVPAAVQAPGDYTLALEGIGDYNGSQTYEFSVVEIPPTPEGLSIDHDYRYPDEGYFYVNLVRTTSVTLSDAAVPVFKVYDNGGKNGNYTGNGYETLIVTAPPGYVIQMSGDMDAVSYDDLTIYDAAGKTNWLKGWLGGTRPVEAASTGRSLTIVFYTQNASGHAGLNLTIRLVFVGVDYAAWSEGNGISGAWNATDDLGVHNVFRYAFDDTNAVPDPPFLSIAFDADGRPLVLTPPVANVKGFSFSLLATDDLGGTNAVPYPLDPSGTNAIPGEIAPARFFRLKATEQ